MNLHRLDRGGRRMLAPKLIDQPFAAERLVCAATATPAVRALLATPGPDLAALAEGFERTEDAEIHLRAGSGGQVEGTYIAASRPASRDRPAFTALLPLRHNVPHAWIDGVAPTTQRAGVSRPPQDRRQTCAKSSPNSTLPSFSHYTQLRALLAIAMIAVVGLTAAVVILATKEGDGTGANSAEPVSAPGNAPGVRPDGGPEESTRGPLNRPQGATGGAALRPDGGPEESTRLR